MWKHSLLLALLGAGLALVLTLPSPADEAPSKEKIDKLIEQLGSGTFKEREKANKQLAAIGLPALEALRKAAKSEDAEVRKRAEDLLPKIEIQAESARLLKPKRIHLVYKDVPFSKAFADLQKTSGYYFTLVSLNDEKKLFGDGTVTLDTGETSFWHALELFCENVGAVEVTRLEMLQAQQKAAGGAQGGLGIQGRRGGLPPGAFGRMTPGVPGTIFLTAGKYEKRPIDDKSAVRVRALKKSDQFAEAAKGEVLLPLEVTPEPRMQWQNLQSVHITKAVDDKDQELGQVIPQVEAAGNPAAAVNVPPGGVMIARPAIARPLALGNEPYTQVPVYLKKGVKEAKKLKELKGTITAQLLTEPRPFITVDQLAKAAGKTFKGDEGGHIKILSVNTAKQGTTIRLDFEQPSTDKIVPANLGMLPPGARGGFGGAAQPKAAPAPAPAAPPAPPAPGGAPAPPAVAAPRVMGLSNGLSIQDDKGNDLPIQVGPVQFRVMAVPGGNRAQVITYTLICEPDKDQGEPARIVYLGRKRVTVEIPFALENVPLP